MFGKLNKNFTCLTWLYSDFYRFNSKKKLRKASRNSKLPVKNTKDLNFTIRKGEKRNLNLLPFFLKFLFQLDCEEQTFLNLQKNFNSNHNYRRKNFLKSEKEKFYVRSTLY